MRMASSGEKNSFPPSISFRKVTPSSVIFLLEDKEKTWNPPESVRMGPW